MNKEQLDAIKERVTNMKQQAQMGVTADILAIEIAFQDVPILIAEVERLKEEYEVTDDLFHRTNEQLGYEYEENARLREALKFYADDKNYKDFETSITIGDTPHYFETNNIEIDNGSIAEKALGDADE